MRTPTDILTFPRFFVSLQCVCSLQGSNQTDLLNIYHAGSLKNAYCMTVLINYLQYVLQCEGMSSTMRGETALMGVQAQVSLFLIVRPQESLMLIVRTQVSLM